MADRALSSGRRRRRCHPQMVGIEIDVPAGLIASLSDALDDERPGVDSPAVGGAGGRGVVGGITGLAEGETSRHFCGPDERRRWRPPKR